MKYSKLSYDILQYYIYSKIPSFFAANFVYKNTIKGKRKEIDKLSQHSLIFLVIVGHSLCLVNFRSLKIQSFATFRKEAIILHWKMPVFTAFEK